MVATHCPEGGRGSPQGLPPRHPPLGEPSSKSWSHCLGGRDGRGKQETGTPSAVFQMHRNSHSAQLLCFFICLKAPTALSSNTCCLQRLVIEDHVLEEVKASLEYWSPPGVASSTSSSLSGTGQEVLISLKSSVNFSGVGVC